MSFPTKDERKKCWDARDQFWNCLDMYPNETNQLEVKACLKFRQMYEAACPSQWVQHFDRKRDYLKFKEKIEKHGRTLTSNVSLSPGVNSCPRQRRPFKQIMNDNSAVVEAAARLQNALEKNSIETLLPSVFRVFIDSSRNGCEVPSEILEKSSENLLLVLKSDQLYNDSKILVATAYVSIQHLLRKDTEEIFKHFLLLLQQRDRQPFNVFICYAALQFNHRYWSTDSKSKVLYVEEVFNLVQNLCCELKSTTFIAYKVLNIMLCKINFMHLKGIVVTSDMFSAMLNIVMCNWENPLSGVRQQITLILEQMLRFDETIWDSVLPKHGNSVFSTNLQHQRFIEMILIDIPWLLKSKYFLLNAILQDVDAATVFEVFGADIVEGLMYSLSVPKLVSAGTDLYLTVLVQLLPDEWRRWFLDPFLKLISQPKHQLELENLFAYWMQHTVKEIPPIFDELIQYESLNLYSFLCLKIIARKEGFHHSCWSVLDENLIREAIEDYSDVIRAQAFSLVCISAKTSIPPSEDEIDMVKQVLRQNVNSDNPAFRHCLLNSFAKFSIRIRDSLLYFIKNKSGDKSTLVHCFSFFDWLHSFMVTNMKKGCNYQRKITTLELLKIILTYFGEPSNKQENPYSRKSNKDHLNLKSNSSLFLWDYKFESKHIKNVLFECLYDEDNNIRSNSATVLTKYFKICDSDYDQVEDLFNTGISLSLSQLFYVAESGASMIRLLVNLAQNSSSEKIKHLICGRNGNSILNVLLDSAEEQYESLLTDFLKAASQKSFLYGTLQCLHLLLSDLSKQEFMIIDNNLLDRLLCLIENITKHFIDLLSLKSSSNFDYAPSFGEMGMAIAHVVDSSSIKDTDVTSTESEESGIDLQLTPAQQLVLSCVWLNLKECCRLSERLVCGGLNVKDTERCLSLVVSVLRRCRHKGAIESAGLSLSHITRHITSSETPELIELPTKLLDDFLQSLVQNTATTISRRSAGLAILVHRLITGDSRPKKPLLHKCLLHLLPIASNPEVSVDSLVDLPQSQALHFLKMLILESSLREHMVQYTLDISMAALTNLASPLWTVRNAALQLFGSLVPKLVGQKPHQAEVKQNHYAAFEELYYQAKPLVDLMLDKFAEAASTNEIDVHSKLMPLLTLVTSLTAGLQCRISLEIKKVVNVFQTFFQKLFKSSIFNVRKLSAKAHSLFLHTSEIAPTIESRVKQILACLNGLECSIESENELHGYLLNVKELFNRFKEEQFGMKVLKLQIAKVDNALQTLCYTILTGKHSFFVKSLVFDFPCSINMDHDCRLNILLNQFSDVYLGLPHFVKKQLNYVISNSNEESIKYIMHTCLFGGYSHDIQLSCLKSVKSLLKLPKKHSQSYSQISILKELQNYILSVTHISELVAYSFEVMSLFLESSLVRDLYPTVKIEIYKSKFFTYCIDTVFSNDISTAILKSLFPFTCSVLANDEFDDFNILHKITNFIKCRTDPAFDQDIRILMAKSMVFLIPVLKWKIIKTTMSGKLIWESCLAFLQDEVVEVRFEASRFVSIFCFDKSDALNTFLSLESLFDNSCIIQLMLPEEALESLCDKIIRGSMERNFKNNISNPYDHGTKNVYAERRIVSNLSYCAILELIKSNKSALKEKAIEKCKEFMKNDISSPDIVKFVDEIQDIINH